MAVVVVPAHRHHRQPGPEPAEQVRVLVAAAVVRHLEHVRRAAPGGTRASRCCASGSMSPAIRIRTPAHLDEQHQAGVVGHRPLLALLVPPAAPAVTGPTTCQVSAPTRRTSPYGGTRTGTRAAAAQRCTSRAPYAGSSVAVTSTSPTRRPASTAAQPVDVVGVEVGEHHHRQRPHPEPVEAAVIAGGSGPVSTTTAAPSPALSTSPSPCPTSQATSTQPPGGQPGLGSGRTITTTSTTHIGTAQRGRRSTRPAPSPTTRQSTASSRSGSGPGDQSSAAVGSRARRTATRITHDAQSPASRPATAAEPGGAAGRPPRPADPGRSPARPPRRPRGSRPPPPG